MSERPLLTVDLDGVICRPPLGMNVGIHRRFLAPDEESAPARVPPRWLSAPWDAARFGLRRPLPGSREALAKLCELRRVVVLTGRRSSPDRWLQRHRLAQYVEAVIVNYTRDASPHYKLRCVQRLGAAEHVDDDPRTVDLLARRSPARVYVRDWPRNRGLPYPPGVTRVADLAELARVLSEGAPPAGEGVAR